MIFNKLVLPPPEFPSITTNSPCLIEREAPLKAATPYNPNKYVLWILSPLIMYSPHLHLHYLIILLLDID